MDADLLRPVTRVVTFVVATVALTLSGGAPSWTDSIRPTGGGVTSADSSAP